MVGNSAVRSERPVDWLQSRPTSVWTVKNRIQYIFPKIVFILKSVWPLNNYYRWLKTFIFKTVLYLYKHIKKKQVQLFWSQLGYNKCTSTQKSIPTTCKYFPKPSVSVLYNNIYLNIKKIENYDLFIIK